MSKENTSLTTATHTDLAKTGDAPAAEFEDTAVRLHDAIARDKRSIESHLAALQVELDRGMEQVAETRDKVLDLKDDAEERIELVKGKIERLKDWRGLVRDYPWQTVGVSMALGFYLGSMLRE
jgi:ElaB/YqjD/DUF883 family membrane-anchored ribosome-binding protein